jgi:hypothetical protein
MPTLYGSAVHGFIKLYHEEHFLNEIVEIPAIIKENDPLFVEVGINTGELI